MRRSFWPNFFVVGAAKSGTTALYKEFSLHSEIFLPRQKEPCFFSSFGMETEKLKRSIYPIPLESIVVDEANYGHLFKGINKQTHKAVGDFSTHYLFDYSYTISNMQLFYGADIANIKIVILLRNPIEAAYSNYRMWRMHGIENKPFRVVLRDECPTRYREGYHNIDYIRKFRYSEQVAAYTSAFQRVKIFLFEDYCYNKSETLKILSEFLGLKKPLDYAINYRVNSSGRIRSLFIYNLMHTPEVLSLFRPIVSTILPLQIRCWIFDVVNRFNITQEPMEKEAQTLLCEAYAEDILKLSRLIGRDLRFWIS